MTKQAIIDIVNYFADNIAAQLYFRDFYLDVLDICAMEFPDPKIVKQLIYNFEVLKPSMEDVKQAAIKLTRLNSNLYNDETDTNSKS